MQVIGYGGSCIAYKAERKPTKGEAKIGARSRIVVLKEFYPWDLSDQTSRKGATLVPDVEITSAFNALKSRFESGIAQQIAFYSDDSNHALPPAQVGAANGTVYSVVELANGDILESCRDSLSFNEIARILASLRNALEKLHRRNLLYLDVKPSNIFLFDKERDESRRIALFDFDTVLNLEDKEVAIISCSKGWSPYEVEHKHLDEISPASDVYSVGALLYWLITGEQVTKTVLDDVEWDDFAFLNVCKLLKNTKNARTTVENILRNSLKRSPSEREQRVEVL
jgi:serine/threonine protein kinase